MCRLSLSYSATQTCKLQLGPYVAHTFYLFEQPKQFKGKDEFYFATLMWKKQSKYGKDYWSASVWADHDAQTDQRIFDRALFYMKRTKLDWEVHACNEWSCGCRDDVANDPAGRPYYDFWLRTQLERRAAAE